MCATAVRCASRRVPKAAITAVMQVPMLAPRMTGMAVCRPISPWNASVSAMPIVAALLWIRAVKTSAASSTSSGCSALPTSTWRNTGRSCSGVIALFISAMP